VTTQTVALSDTRTKPLRGSAFFAGLAGLAYQIISYKLILAAGLGDGLSIALSLTAFVTLSGFGAIAVNWFGDRFLVIAEMLLGLYALALFGAISVYGLVPYIEFLDAYGFYAKLTIVLGIQGPLAFLSGALMPIYDRRNRSLAASNSFSLIYALFHFGGAAGLLLMENYLFPTFGYLWAGVAFSLASLANGALSTNQPSIRHHRTAMRPAAGVAFVLFGISIVTGILGIAIYKAFDYIVGPNIRNYTVITASIFVGLGLSGWLSSRRSFTLRTMVALSGVGILLFCILILIIPSTVFTGVFYGLPAFAGYALSALVLCVPVYALVGISIPVSVRLGLNASHALFLSALGNCVGYWLYIGSASLNYDLGWLIIAGAALLLLSRNLRPLIAASVVGIGFVLAGVHITPSVHHSILGERLLTEWALKDQLNGKSVDRDFVVEQSWNTWGAPVDHVALYETSEDGLSQKEYLVISGFTSLSLNDLQNLQYAESAAAVIPTIYAKNTNKALVIGAGTGISAGSVTSFFDQVDLVDINPDTPSMLSYFSSLNWTVSENARLTQQDAFSFLASPQKYDYIFGTATGAGYSFSALLYSREFFDRAKSSLNEQGIYSFWLDGRSPLASTGGQIIVALKSVFKHVKVHTVYPDQISDDGSIPYSVFVASDSPLQIQDHANSVLTFLNPMTSDYHRRHGATIDKFLKARILDATLPSQATPATMKTLAYAYGYQYELRAFENTVGYMKETPTIPFTP